MKPTPIIDPPRTSRSNETVCLTNKFGLHLRAAAKLAQLAGRFNSDIQIRRGNQTVNAKSVLNMIALGVHERRDLEIMAEGDDTEKAVGAIRELIKGKFGELE